MKMRFLLGAAGAGKTATCLDEMVQALRTEGDLAGDRPLYFLVPEQATFQMERALLKRDPAIRATSRARVVSFKRLCHFAVQRTGPTTRVHLGELGKLLALHVAVERERSNLQAFGKAAHTDGFLEAMAATYTELRTYRLNFDAVERAAEHLTATGTRTNDGLYQKLHDVARIGRAYEGFIAGRFQDTHDLVETALGAVVASGLFSGARIWIDGFAGFTPQEFALLEVLMGQCDEMTVALCIDPEEVAATPVALWEEGPEDGLFQLTRQTLVRLRDMAMAAGASSIAPFFLPEAEKAVPGGALPTPPRFASAPFLYALERALIESDAGAAAAARTVFDDVAKAAAKKEALIVEAPNPQGEVSAAAEEIQRLVREEGYRYRDIAVIVRDLERYRHALETTLSQWEIPYFIDDKPSAYHHPVVTLLRGAIDLCQGDAQTDVVLRCLKSDFVPLSRGEVDLLENEALALGIEGEGWFDEQVWEMTEYAALWKEAMGPFHRFRRQMRQAPSATASHYLDALTQLLNELNVSAQLAVWSQKAADEGDVLGAGDHLQVWEALVSLFEQVALVLADERLSLSELAGMLNAGFQRLQLGRVPPRLDQVLIGSVERSRQPDLACTIVLGLNDGLFPAIPAEDPVFSDDDRALLYRLGVELGPGSRQRLFHEKYLLYIALTRAARRLVLTYSRSDESGKPLRPAPLIGWLARRLPDLPRIVLGTRPGEAQWPEGAFAVWGWLARTCRDRLDKGPGGGPPRERVLALYDWAVRVCGEPSPWAEPMRALVYRNVSGPLSQESVHALYGPSYAASPSRLESLAACAFQHFAGYGLRLNERRRLEVDAAVLGTLVHKALSTFVGRLIQEGIDWATLDRSESDARIDDAVELELARMGEALFGRQAGDRYVARRVKGMLRDVAWVLGEHCRRGDFRPVAVEVAFGDSGRLPPVSITTGEGNTVHVYGRIDRIDVVEEAGSQWVRVIDYKSSRRSFRLDRVHFGIDLQLILYLYAAVQPQRVEKDESGAEGHGVHGARRAAGCMYLPIQDPLLSVEAPLPPDDASWQKALKGAGLIVDEGDIPRRMDLTSQGHSDLVPLYFKKDGTLGSASNTLSGERMQRLFVHAEHVVGDLVDAWAAGRTDIAPYRLSQETPCTFCAYRSVCQFDATLASNQYRQLLPMADEQVWQVIEDGAGDVADGGDGRVG